MKTKPNFLLTEKYFSLTNFLMANKYRKVLKVVSRKPLSTKQTRPKLHFVFQIARRYIIYIKTRKS